MKKYLIITLIIMSCILTSCSGRATPCSDICVRIVSLFDVRGEISYISTARQGSPLYLDASGAGNLYRGRDEALSDLSLCDDFCVYTANEAVCFEIHIFHVKNRSDRDRAEEFLSHRAELINRAEIHGEDGALLGHDGDCASVFAVNNYICLAVTDDNAAAEDMFRRLCG